MINLAVPTGEETGPPVLGLVVLVGVSEMPSPGDTDVGQFTPGSDWIVIN